MGGGHSYLQGHTHSPTRHKLLGHLQPLCNTFACKEPSLKLKVIKCNSKCSWHWLIDSQTLKSSLCVYSSLQGPMGMTQHHFISASHWLHSAAGFSKWSVFLISYFPFGFYLWNPAFFHPEFIPSRTVSSDSIVVAPAARPMGPTSGLFGRLMGMDTVQWV